MCIMNVMERVKTFLKKSVRIVLNTLQGIVLLVVAGVLINLLAPSTFQALLRYWRIAVILLLIVVVNRMLKR